MYLLDLSSGVEHLLTPHVGVAVANQAEFIDDDSVLISTNIDREMIALARIEIGQDGVPGPLNYIAGREDAELSGFEILADDQVALLWNAAGRSELQYLDLASGEIAQGPVLPAEIAGGLEPSPDGTALALTLSGSAAPTNVWFLDVGSGAVNQVSASPHTGVELKALVRPQLHIYPAHDGLELSGWLYPAAGDSGAGPMVLSFHGGPEGQERPGFRSIYQALAARGRRPARRDDAYHGVEQCNKPGGVCKHFHGLAAPCRCSSWLVERSAGQSRSFASFASSAAKGMMAPVSFTTTSTCAPSGRRTSPASTMAPFSTMPV
jgi:hypothetical protein